MKNTRRPAALPIICFLLIGALTVLLNIAQESPATAQPSEDTVTLKIEGWTCASCEKDIRRALLAVAGVKSADVSYARGGAIVVIEAGRVTPDQLVRAVASAGNILSSYRAIVVPNGTLTAEHAEPEGAWSRFWNLLK